MMIVMTNQQVTTSQPPQHLVSSKIPTGGVSLLINV